MYCDKHSLPLNENASITGSSLILLTCIEGTGISTK